MNFSDYYEILTEKLSTWAEAAVAALPNLAVALLVTIVFYLAARVSASLARKAVARATDSRALVALSTSTLKYTVLACGLFVALGILGLQKTVFSLLAGAGIAGLAIGFAFQDLAANFISGIFIAFQRPFRIGDVIRCGDYLGTVSKIRLRNTLVETFDGHMVVMPNRELFENPLTNYSTTGSRRIELAVGVGYDSDLEQVTEVARRAIEQLDFRQQDKDVTVAAREFGGSSIDFTVRYWIDYPDGDVGYVEAVHRGVLAVKKAFDEAGIDIPFPIRTLDFSRTTDQAANLELTELKRTG